MTSGDLSSVDQGVVSFKSQALKLDTTEDAKVIVSALTRPGYGDTHTLILEGNTLGIPAAKEIGEALEQLTRLQRVFFNNLFTGRSKDEVPTALHYLLDGITTSGAYLVELDLSDNAFGEIGMDCVAPFLQSQSCERLHTLQLNNNGLGLKGGALLADAIQDLKCLKILTVGGNRFTSSSTNEDVSGLIGSALSNLMNLEVLEMPRNGIRVQGIMCISQAIQSNQNLKVLNLNDNIITSKGAVPLATALGQCLALESLNLGDCLLKNTGVAVILKSLIEGRVSSLKYINLSGNECSSEDVVDLLQTFVSRTGCEPGVEVDLSCNYFDEDLCERIQSISNIEVILAEDDETASEEDDDEEIEKLETLIAKLEDSSATNENKVISFQGQALKLDTAEDAKEIVDALTSPSNRNSNTLILEGNTLGIPAAAAIGAALEHLPRLQHAVLKDLFTSRLKNEVPIALKHLHDGITASGAYLVELDLSDNAFGPIGMESVKPFLQSPSCERLEILRLNNCGLGLPGGALLADALGNLKNLRTLVVGRNRLASSSTKDDVAGRLGSALSTLTNLEVLEMPQNGLRAEGIISLVAAVESNRNLKVLNLNDNSITPKGAAPLANALSHCSSLETLNLGDCILKNKGVALILKSLMEGRVSSLKYINLSGNEASTEEIVYLVETLVNKTGCEHGIEVDLSCNAFGRLSDRLESISNIKLLLEDDDGTPSEGESEDADDSSS